MIVIVTAPSDVHTRTRYEFAALREVDVDDDVLHRVLEVQIHDDRSQRAVMGEMITLGVFSNMANWPEDRPMRLFGDMAKFTVANFMGSGKQA